MRLQAEGQQIIGSRLLDREANRRAHRRALEKSTAELKTEIQKAQTDTPHTGRIYPRSGGRVHVASRTGETPSPDTRRLLNAVLSNILSDTKAEVRIDLYYGFLLETRFQREFFYKTSRKFGDRFAQIVKQERARI